MARHLINQMSNLRLQGELISFTLEDEDNVSGEATRVANVAIRRQDLLSILAEFANAFESEMDDEMRQVEKEVANDVAQEAALKGDSWHFGDPERVVKPRAPFSYGMPVRRGERPAPSSANTNGKMLRIEFSQAKIG